MTQWKLVLEKTGEPVVFGQSYPDFREKFSIITGGTPPHKPQSTGRVEAGAGFEFFPGVFGMKWVDENDIRRPKLPLPVSPDPLAINTGERSLYKWQCGALGGFERALWSAIVAADSTNLAALGAGFPEHVTAYQRYASEHGYWTSLRARIEAERN